MSEKNKKYKKIVLAYSGGLDTSIIIPWLKENYDNPEIIAVAGNVGLADELDGLEEKALATGASKLIIAELMDEMVDDVIIPSLKMGAKYETYLLGTAFARPVIAKKLAEVALEEGADAIAHGCTGKGNDQVRFELALKRWAPEIDIIAPWREWDIKSSMQRHIMYLLRLQGRPTIPRIRTSGISATRGSTLRIRPQSLSMRRKVSSRWEFPLCRLRMNLHM